MTRQQQEGSWIEKFLGGPISTFGDRQRLERVRKCLELDHVLKTCIKRRMAGQALSKDDAVIEDTAIGMRMLLYYAWRDLEKDSRQNETISNDEREKQTTSSQHELDNNNSKASSNVLIPTCAKEMHSVWGCRAVSLKCGAELVELKTCFVQYDPKQLLSISQTNYEGKGDNVSEMVIPCREQQRIVGQCVLKNAALLEEKLGSIKK